MPSAACADVSWGLNNLRALLVVIAHHPPKQHVERLKTCLDQLPSDFAYAVVINSHCPGEAAEDLLPAAALSIVQRSNPGYGRSFNQLWQQWCDQRNEPPLVAVLNTDLSWDPEIFERFATWLEEHHDITAATPELRFPNGQRQFLCKRNPTLLALVSRRCIPRRLKPRRLRRYDNWYTMRDKPYSHVFASSYLSGCCLWMRGWAVQAVGGFDPRFFLYFEDADITRRLAAHGPTVNLPICTVTHHWGRGSYRNIWLTLVNLHSAWLYFRKWGLRWW
ncbi:MULTISPECIES: glycosyltransferase family 2 protein [unclassified Synechococcus]|uniref:glycosyltransferase family 2 protein n=1 Tax=unclassified Synechococcus TaxID=2626047 RepID=UPI0039AF19DB